MWKADRVAELLGVPYRTLMSWIEKGIFRPASYTGRRGAPVLFSLKDVRELFVYSTLRQHFSPREIGGMMHALREAGHNPFSTGHFIVVKDDLVKGPHVIKIDGDGIRELSKMAKGAPLRLFPFDDADADLVHLVVEGKEERPVVSVHRPRVPKK